VSGRLLILIALLVAFAVDAASAAPLRIVRDLRARGCCQRNCVQMLGAVCETGCCPGEKSVREGALATAAKYDQAPVGVGMPAVFTVRSAPLEVERNLAPVPHVGNDPPAMFLLNSTLRL
jgi:hypothetical protein